MSKENITQLIKQIHEEEVNKQLVEDVLLESEKGFSEEIMSEVQSLLKKANKSNVVAFPDRKIRLAQTQLTAAGGQELGAWFEHPIIFESTGMVVDVRKVFGKDDKVNVYVHPNGDDSSLIEKSLLPFKDKTLQVRLSIDGIELLQAEIYVDDTGSNAEGSGYIQSAKERNVHGDIDLDIIVED